ncbi:2TM domain-containing protein [Chryseobacterium oryctis]|uniref:2TM domain-containing protein n=1 Tax=Chryseobacterium oryctis TaxID=2952618 RepID=A0ABT3HLL9_9FLAO|nr:2TM domain-containing protein [Chryseobacterium oryctis]MCW3160676.1 2TM domain-containing protein [Chryseobacterium oryctis]
MNYNQAQQRVNDLRKFYKNLTWFGIVALFIFFNRVFENGKINLSLFHGSLILTIWAIILVVKAVKLFVLDSEWERKVMQKEIEKSKENF